MLNIATLLLLVLNIIVVLCSSCLTLLICVLFVQHHQCYAFFLFEVIVLLFLFDVLLCFIYSMSLLLYVPFAWSCCFTPFVHVVVFVLFNLLFCSSCSTPVFSLFDISAPLARHWCSSYLTLLFRSSCSTYYSYSMLLFILFNAIAPCSFRYLSTTPMILLFFVIFAQCCNSCSSCFRLVFPPLLFCRCGRTIQIQIP